MMVGYEVSTADGNLIDEDYVFYRFDGHHFPESYSSDQHLIGKNADGVTLITLPESKEVLSPLEIETMKKESTPVAMSGGPMDSPWQMHGHDIRYTGRSPYGTADNPGIEIWLFKTEDVADCSPVIDNNGTIYIGSTEFYAVYPNGTLKWKYDVPFRIVTSAPAIGEDGIVYIGTIWAMPNYLYAFYTTNGTLKWRYDTGDSLESSPAIGDDGTIYFGTTSMDGGQLKFIALNKDGTEKWRKDIKTSFSSPAIGEDGTVYIGSWGGLRAFGDYGPNAPEAPTISGRKNGKPSKDYNYKFTTIDPNGDDIYYYIEWGDGAVENWIGSYGSGEKISLNHTWTEKGTYTIRARAQDTDNLLGPWGELEVSMPMNQKSQNWWFLQFLQNHPRMFPILRHLLGL